MQKPIVTKLERRLKLSKPPKNYDFKLNPNVPDVLIVDFDGERPKAT